LAETEPAIRVSHVSLASLLIWRAELDSDAGKRRAAAIRDFAFDSACRRRLRDEAGGHQQQHEEDRADDPDPVDVHTLAPFFLLRYDTQYNETVHFTSASDWAWSSVDVCGLSCDTIARYARLYITDEMRFPRKRHCHEFKEVDISSKIQHDGLRNNV
jgi:hypothetical protein